MENHIVLNIIYFARKEILIIHLLFIIGIFGFIDATGKKVISIEYHDADDFSEGLGRVKSGDKWGYVNKSGSMIIKPAFDSADPFGAC